MVRDLIINELYQSDLPPSAVEDLALDLTGQALQLVRSGALPKPLIGELVKRALRSGNHNLRSALPSFSKSARPNED